MSLGMHTERRPHEDAALQKMCLRFCGSTAKLSDVKSTTFPHRKSDAFCRGCSMLSNEYLLL